MYYKKKSFLDFNHNLNPTTRHGLENLKHFYKTPTICVHQTNVYLEKQLKSTSDKKNYSLFFFHLKSVRNISSIWTEMFWHLKKIPLILVKLTLEKNQMLTLKNSLYNYPLKQKLILKLLFVHSKTLKYLDSQKLTVCYFFKNTDLAWIKETLTIVLNSRFMYMSTT